MPDAVVTNRAGYRYTVDDAVATADYGDKITVSEEELKRGKGLGYLDTPGSEAGKAAAQDAETGYSPAGGPSFEGAPGAMTEEELGKLKRDELVEHAAAAGVQGADTMTVAELRAAIQAAGAISTGPATPSP